jgi:phosphoribosylanthranilate isomerase
MTKDEPMIPDAAPPHGPWVKICGLRTAGDVEVAIDAGADAVGFVFAPGSPRLVEVALAASLVRAAGGRALTVGVFRDQPVDEVLRIAEAASLDAVQLHGAEPAADFRHVADAGYPVIHGLTRAALGGGYDPAAFAGAIPLLDGDQPGSGAAHDVSDVRDLLPPRWILAGGLRPDTVAARIAELSPWGVDVSSGVESSRGVKDPELIRRFVAAARAIPAASVRPQGEQR